MSEDPSKMFGYLHIDEKMKSRETRVLTQEEVMFTWDLENIDETIIENVDETMIENVDESIIENVDEAIITKESEFTEQSSNSVAQNEKTKHKRRNKKQQHEKEGIEHVPAIEKEEVTVKEEEEFPKKKKQSKKQISNKIQEHSNFTIVSTEATHIDEDLNTKKTKQKRAKKVIQQNYFGQDVQDKLTEDTERKENEGDLNNMEEVDETVLQNESGFEEQSQNSVAHNKKTKQKRGRNKKQQREKEGIEHVPVIEKEEVTVKEEEEFPKKKKQSKKQISNKIHGLSNFTFVSTEATHDDEDLNTKKINEKREKNVIQQNYFGQDIQDKMTEDTERKENEGGECSSENSEDKSQGNNGKLKSEKAKPKLDDSSDIVKKSEPRGTENKPKKANNSVKGKQKNTASDLKENDNPKNALEEDEAEMKENARSKRKVTKKNHTEEKKVEATPKVKKETKVKESLQSNSNASEEDYMEDNPLKDNVKSKPRRKGKKGLEEKENEDKTEIKNVEKKASRKK